MHILALEPYYGGSHQAFIDGWQKRSRHDFTLLTLPPYKWKWRMRHSAITFAKQTAELLADGCPWDAVWCSDMLNLASFLGLAPPALRRLPVVAYFHENQLTYPVRYQKSRDQHFSFTNLTTALAADAVWFNSQYHLDAFLTAFATWCRKMPDYQPTDAIAQIEGKAAVMPPGIRDIQPPRLPADGPLHILWAARWEYDKDPETFFAALDLLAERGCEFRLSVLGEQFRNSPAIFEEARERHAERLVHWGYQPTRQAYEAALRQAHVMVSTAQHEFFGISILEGALAGLYPLVPNALAYPETLEADANPDFFYEAGPEALADRLAALHQRHQDGNLWRGDPDRARACAERYLWSERVPVMDDALAALTGQPS